MWAYRRFMEEGFMRGLLMSILDPLKNILEADELALMMWLTDPGKRNEFMERLIKVYLNPKNLSEFTWIQCCIYVKG